MARDLNGYVSGGAKSVEAERAAGLDSGETQAAKTDNASAEKRRGLFIGKLMRNRVDETFRSDDVFGISAIHGIAGERRVVTKIFGAGAAIIASAVGVM